MLALRTYAKDDPSQLVYEDAPVPSLAPDDALVRVRASGVTPSELAWGTPRPAPIIPGHEVAGVVEAIGPAAVGVAVGDAVYGLIDFHHDGADAEYAAVRAADLAPKPATLTFAEAAAAPLSALTAWQALFEHGDLRPGQRVLVHGGAGGVGAFAVQLARWRGARVATTASARDADLLRELGADEVVDYRAQRFEDALAAVDVVLDTVGGDTWERSWRVLRPGGRLVSIAVPRPPDRAGPEGQRAIWFVVRPDREQLVELGRLFDGGQVRAIMSAVVPLADGRGAYGPGRSGRGPGKVVLLVEAQAGPARAPTRTHRGPAGPGR
jgi:NADPH:quinone reductase-like Zn-dependent oxidoreductase